MSRVREIVSYYTVFLEVNRNVMFRVFGGEEKLKQRSDFQRKCFWD